MKKTLYVFIILFCIILTSCNRQPQKEIPTTTLPLHTNTITTESPKEEVKELIVADKYFDNLTKVLTDIKFKNGRWVNYDLAAFSLEDVNDDDRNEVILYSYYDENNQKKNNTLTHNILQ